MILRRVIECVRTRNWIAVALALLALSASPIARAQALAEALPADALAPAFLAECDARAAASGAYDPEIAGAVLALTNLGVFDRDAFEGVKIGFCPLRVAGGPVATTSCADDVILLDVKYADPAQRLVLNATLAHEMTHYLQHQEGKAASGDGYCASAAYAADKAWMEREADAFGDAVGELFVIGRAVEVRNDCATAVSVYVEAAAPMAGSDQAIGFLTVAPGMSAHWPERSTSRLHQFYAETAENSGEARAWRGADGGRRRFIGGQTIQLREISLPAAAPADGPFRLTLSCTPD
ncbi:MAG: hypothetical protein GC152_12540 [Alphaproteobacteria bacterium]|nr:hypothetical protein [Alphaproteobacteria bacterium]